jgi:hypothetical protein
LKPFKGGYYTIASLPWYVHNALFYLVRYTALPFLSLTPVCPWFLRAMGMKLGKRVLLGRGFSQVVDPDMIEVDDGATVDAMLQAHTFEDRVLKIDRIRIRRGAMLGTGTVPLYGADIGEGTDVAPHSVIMKRESLTAGLRYEGVPTRSRPESVLG